MNAQSGNKKSRLRDYIDERKWERVSEWERNKIYFTQALFAASYEVKIYKREREVDLRFCYQPKLISKFKGQCSFISHSHLHPKETIRQSYKATLQHVIFFKSVQ